MNSFQIKQKIMYIELVEQHEIKKLLELRMFHVVLFKFFLKSKILIRYTFFTSENAKQAPSLVRVLQEAGQKVNQDLMEIAEDQQYTTGSKHGK